MFLCFAPLLEYEFYVHGSVFCIGFQLKSFVAGGNYDNNFYISGDEDNYDFVATCSVSLCE